jgi:hypothetical protein
MKFIEKKEKKIIEGIVVELSLSELATIVEALGQTCASEMKKNFSGDVNLTDLLDDNFSLYNSLLKIYQGAK